MWLKKRLLQAMDSFFDRFVELLDRAANWVDNHCHWTKKALGVCTGDPFSLFLVLIKTHSMTGKVDLHRHWHFGELTWTLYGVVEQEGDPSPLTEDFKKAFVRLAERQKKLWESREGECYRFSYKIYPDSVTTEWIQKQDAAWRAHCEMACS